MADATPESIERELLTVADALTAPLPVECVLCYVWRMLDTFGCDATLRWARRWRDARAPRATSLEHRLGQRGGFCDCEIFLNGWVQVADVQRYVAVPSDGPPAPRPLCMGVRRGSSQPCFQWTRRPSPWPRC